MESLLISLVSTIMFGFLGLTNWKAAKSLELLVEQKYTVLERKFDDLLVESNQEMGRMHELEKALLQLRAELPEKYVSRDDAIRLMAVTDARLEALRSDVQTIRLMLEARK